MSGNVVRCPQGRLAHIALRIDGSAVTTSASSTGLLFGTGQATVAKGSGGTANEVTIVLKKKVAGVPIVVAQPITTNCHIDLKSVSVSNGVATIVLKTFQVADGITGVNDVDMHVMIDVPLNSRDG